MTASSSNGWIMRVSTMFFRVSPFEETSVSRSLSHAARSAGFALTPLNSRST
eukprot:CAMPEP_0171795672 /NCGR_PEP_ID=MMETSP0991-20121206/68859_1 /TAXON_ID=483369 /ORGANISM="non described non described, Strain CCMP2098" /LENGTH=51 /DNA_ID=CAMNT_0012406307 /DNA_START=16 /DNA_END=168 /DNA_ORIENTATION=-